VSAEERDQLIASLPTLLRALAEHGVTELEVSAGQATLYLRQRAGQFGWRAAASAGGDSGPGDLAADGLVAVTSPLAGVFYDAPSPDEPAFVAPGEVVEAGQVVALVEAMKVFNEIHVDVAGTVLAVLLTSGQPVQAGQALITIRPDVPATTEES
jgi:acetyl-CoA carboxylase biotin carboxyl carrier protein